MKWINIGALIFLLISFALFVMPYAFNSGWIGIIFVFVFVLGILNATYFLIFRKKKNA